MASDTHGFYIDDGSEVNYQGIPMENIAKHYRGDFIYNAEVDTHFPHLTVGQTLKFAALARTPSNRFSGVSRDQYAIHMRDVIMATFGLSHTMNTKVGDDYVRGVSGGERKRVSLAEACLNGAALQCWDNSTRGLDSATALEFVKSLKNSSQYTGTSCFVSLYQASQDSYDLFDKVTVLYEGRQIYFGPTATAKTFFTDMGFVCPERQTTGDFLTSLTNPAERVVAKGFENCVPRTAADFEKRWQESKMFQQLISEIDQFNKDHPLGGEGLENFQQARDARKSKNVRKRSPYTISFLMQIKLCISRGFDRLWGDMSMASTTVFGQFIMALIIASIFFNMQENTDTFFSRAALLFFSVLMNAMASALEILVLYAQRPIVEKHTRYALYHPSAEAVASMLCDMPTKIITSMAFNLTLYFMANLRREPGAFFIFFLFSFACMMVMSMLFRTIAACSRTMASALTPASLLIMALIIYTGFAIPVNYMRGWSRWINYINPMGYAFESLMANEFRNRKFDCAAFFPAGEGYESLDASQKTCFVPGYTSPPGQTRIDGDDYVYKKYEYDASNMWRNLGILFAFMIFFCCTYLVATELIQAAKSRGEILVFKRGHLATKMRDTESGGSTAHENSPTTDSTEQAGINIEKQNGIFQWMDVCYDIPVKGPEKTRRILSHVDGWVKPGTLTALMGASGAGKTTLLDVLANRVTTGVVSGDILVNGDPRNASFQRKTGYVQQQDLHLQTSTVYEALTFSALLRQPENVPHEEKIAYVDEVIRLLEMEAYAEAVVGVPGEGLNVEQRKRLTIGVELVAKPALLLFLDEPTSGLDSQTSWSICALMRKLANSGQAILCTIHQPSAILFQEFDQLLFLEKGGRTVYFGEIGPNSKTMTDYFERNGADPCPPDANPAEWMLSVIGAAPGSVAKRDFHEVWCQSSERQVLRAELASMANELRQNPDAGSNEAHYMKPFASSPWAQLVQVTKRVWQQYWRTPEYIWAKLAMTIITPLFIGFSFFKESNDFQGLQDQMFAFFMLTAMFGTMAEQIMPQFVTQRSLYEVRERPSKTYSWPVFVISNILTEIPWQTIGAVVSFFVFYYPIGFYENATYTDTVHERGFLSFLFILEFYIYSSTFAQMVVAGVDTAETGANIGNLLFTFFLLMCGVLATPSAMPGFWIFMYRLSPFTYIISGMLQTGVKDAPMKCSENQFLIFDPPAGSSCAEFLSPFLKAPDGGYLTNEAATSSCQYCPMRNTNGFLSQLEIGVNTAWRDFGILIAYIIFNIFTAMFLYWLARVPKKTNKKNKIAISN